MLAKKSIVISQALFFLQPNSIWSGHFSFAPLIKLQLLFTYFSNRLKKFSIASLLTKTPFTPVTSTVSINKAKP